MGGCRTRLTVASLVLGILGSTGVAGADVTNAGFETDVIADGDWTGTPPSGWTGAGDTGTLNPSVAMFSGEAPEGLNVAYSNANPICQVIGTVTDGGWYAAEALVGRRLDDNDDVPACGIELRSTSGVRCSDTNGALAKDSWARVACAFTAAGSGDVDHLQPLTLCLISSGIQCNFDDAWDGLFRDGFELGDTSAWNASLP